MNLPRVGQTDVGLRVPTEANLAQEAGFLQYEGVVTLVEEMVGTMKSLIGFVSILNMWEPTGIGTHDIVGKGWVTAFNAQRMGGLNRRLEEITTPLNGPLDDQPLRVVVDLVGEMRGREEAIDVFSWGLGISEDLIDLL